MNSWSVSSIKAWSTCQLQWWFRRKGFKEEFRSLPLVEGSVVHAVIAFTLRGLKDEGAMPPEDEALALLDAELFQEELQGPIQWGKMNRERVLHRMESLYRHWRTEFQQDCEIEAVEQEIRVELPGLHLPLLGYVDLVLRRPEGLEVIDFKVVSSRPVTDHLMDPLDLQKLAMTRGYEASAGKPVTSWKWVNLIKTKNPQIVEERWAVSESEGKRDIANLQRIVNPSIVQMDAALSGTVQAVPSQSFMAPCGSCGYRNSCALGVAAASKNYPGTQVR